MVLAAVVGAWSITVPSLWRDESVSLYFARAPLGEAWRRWGEVDAVHATYYLMLRPFTWIEPIELAARVPSLIAFVITTAGVVLLGRRLSGWSAGLCAGCVYALLPLASRYAQEGRSYALVSGVAVFGTLALLRACDRPSVGRLAIYAGSIAALGYLHLYALLLIVVHVVHLLVTARAPVRRFVAAWVTAGLLVLPLAIVASGQRERQLFWLRSPDTSELLDFARAFGGTSLATIALGLLVVAGAWFLRAQPIATVWATAPVVISFAVSQAYPIFVDRYVLYVVPAVALLAGAGIDGIARLARLRLATAVARVVGVALIAALALPAQRDVRLPDSRPDDLRSLSRDLAADQRPGDVVMPVPARVQKFASVYSEPFARLDVVPVNTDPLPPDLTRIWVISRGHPSRSADELSDLAAVFRRESVRSYGFTHVSLWVRK
jgi:mannosyltransferase